MTTTAAAAHRAELVLWGGPDRRAEFQGGIRVAEHDARLVL